MLAMVDERLDPVRLSITSLVDLIAARRRGLEMALALGFPLPDATQIAAVISELCRQVIFHGKGGTVTLIAQVTGKRGIKIVAQDHGPGTPNVETVLTGRCPPPPTLRPEVLEARQIMDEFEIVSIGDSVITIRAAKWVV